MRSIGWVPFLGFSVVLAACGDDADGEPSGAGASSSSGGMGGSAGSGGAPPVPCSIDVTNPDSVLGALSIEGGVWVEAAAPATLGSHPLVDNGGCDQATVKRGETLVIPFAFVDTDTPVTGCYVTVEGANGHIDLPLPHCDGGLDLTGELPIEVTIPEEMCAGGFDLRYAARASAPAISTYLTTTIDVTNEVADGSAPQLCASP